MSARKPLSFLAAATFLLTLLPGHARSYAVTNPWNLDRINQAALPLDGNASMGVLTGAGIDVYVVDTGVRPTHEQLNGRVVAGIDVPSSLNIALVTPLASDCDGHGTHVASTIAGASTGVAVQARIIAVRVLDCNGDGEVVDVVEALKWVRAHHVSGRMAIANLSLGVDIGDDGTEIAEMVRSLTTDGIVVVAAAGNGDGTGKGIDACKIVPANEPVAFAVGATTKTDSVAAFSNFGPCVDVYAPGGDRSAAINAAWYRNDSDYMGDIGTSMAAPLASGVFALLGEQQPSLCPGQYMDAVRARAVPNVITGLDGTSANLLLNVNTAPIAGAIVPGRPSNVMITPDSSSLIVSWDNPCDGGSPVISTKVSVLFGGKVVKAVTVPVGSTAVRVRGLVPGRRYSVVLKSTNALGPGTATPRLTTPRVTSLKPGRAIKVTELVRGEGDETTVLTSLTPTRCVVKGETHRLVGVRAGTCRYTFQAPGAQAPTVRTIVVKG